jgi:hypothetical protein
MMKVGDATVAPLTPSLSPHGGEGVICSPRAGKSRLSAHRTRERGGIRSLSPGIGGEGWGEEASSRQETEPSFIANIENPRCAISTWH